MCQLLKYYESENTIFLLVDYHKHGSISPYLHLIRDTIELFPYNLPQLHTLAALHPSHPHHHLATSITTTTASHKASMSSSITMMPANITGGNVRLINQPRLRLSHSFSGIPYSLLHQSTSKSQPKPSNQEEQSDKRRSQSHSQSVHLSKLTAVDLEQQVTTS